MNQPGSSTTRNSAYVLGHTQHEVQRLQAQARLIDPITRRIFERGGLKNGMRVLDIGSGAGDVAFLAAEIVGPSGAVVGIDRSGTALSVARARAVEQSLANVSFVEGDFQHASVPGTFDAIVGRYVLQFQRDPAECLSALHGRLSPGGVLAFHEIDWSGLNSYPPAPLFQRCCALGTETLRRHGTDAMMGRGLYAAFTRAGLKPTLHLEAPIAGGADAAPWLRMFAGLIQTLELEMIKLGVANRDELEVDSLADRLVQEAVDLATVITGHYQIGAWLKKADRNDA